MNKESNKTLKECEAVVLVSVKNEDWLNLIQQNLDKNKKVIQADDPINGEYADVYICDLVSFNKNKEHLKELKELAAPEFLPMVVLVEDAGRPEDLQEVLEVADDVVLFPGASPILNAKVKLWAEHRFNSVKLRNKNEELRIESLNLKKEKSFLNDIANNIPGIFYLLDEDLNFLFVNNNFDPLIGYNLADLEGIHPLDLVVPRHKEMVKEKIDAVFAEGRAEVEASLITKDGEEKPFHLFASNIQRNGKNYLIGSGMDITERINAQQKSEINKKLLDAIINQTSNIIYVKDRDGQVKLANKEYLSVFNWKEEEVIGQYEADLFGTEVRDMVKDHDHYVLDKNETVEFEETVPVKGEKRKYLSVKSPLNNIPGYENCLFGISTDISDQQRLMDELRERVKEQTCLYNIARLNGHPSTVDELLESAVKFLPDGWNYPEITEAQINYAGKSYSTKNFRESEWELVNDVKVIHNHRLTVKVVYTEEKPLLQEGAFLKEERQLIDAIADMLGSQIERIQSKVKLQASEKRWEDLVQNDPDLIQICVGETIKFINPAGALIFGFECPDEVIGKNLFDLVEFDDKAKVMARIERAESGHKNDAHVYRLKTLAGETKYIEVQSMPIVYKEYKHALQVVGKDVTDQILYEQQLKKSIQEKEVLLQEVHHRVKNNLAVISGLLHIQMYESGNEEIKKSLSDSIGRIKSMALIHEKLYEADSLSTINMRIYIDDLIANMCGTFNSDLDISIRKELEDVILNVNQAVPLALIINELVMNSYKHAFNNCETGTITIGLTESDKQVKLVVKDNGSGASKDIMAKENHSLGITIIKTLVDQLNGNTELRNNQGLQTEISFKKRNVKGANSNLSVN